MPPGAKRYARNNTSTSAPPMSNILFLSIASSPFLAASLHDLTSPVHFASALERDVLAERVGPGPAQAENVPFARKGTQPPHPIAPAGATDNALPIDPQLGLSRRQVREPRKHVDAHHRAPVLSSV